MKSKHKIYTDVSIIKDKHIELLVPFLGDLDSDRNDPDFGRFARFQNMGKEFLELVDNPSNADFFVYPIKWEKKSLELKSFLAHASKHNKKTLVFFNDDSDENMDLDEQNIFVFRTSFYRSTKKNNEIAMPGWAFDYGHQSYRKKEDRPIVGFCGCYTNNIYRRRSLESLINSDTIIKNFILYDQFWAGREQQVKENLDHAYAHDVRSKFIDNIKNSDYVLCCRGSGNFSYRLYETLSAGRIPIIIDTDIVLPHEDKIPWNDISVWVKKENIDKIDNIVLKDYDSMSQAEFLERQKTCREIYEDYIRPTSFFNKWFEEN